VAGVFFFFFACFGFVSVSADGSLLGRSKSRDTEFGCDGRNKLTMRAVAVDLDPEPDETVERISFSECCIA